MTSLQCWVQYTGIDITHNMVELAGKRIGQRPNVTLAVANGEKLPFEDANFDRYLRVVLVAC